MVNEEKLVRKRRREKKKFQKKVHFEPYDGKIDLEFLDKKKIDKGKSMKSKARRAENKFESDISDEGITDEEKENDYMSTFRNTQYHEDFDAYGHEWYH